MHKRHFLHNKRIVGAVLAFREGDLIRYTLDNLCKYCDEVLIMLDNHDAKTEAVVLEYGKRDNVHVRYSTIPPLKEEHRHVKGKLKSRLDGRQGEIRDQVLQAVRDIHYKRPVDLLIWLDADEILVKDFPEYLAWFWNSDYRVLFTGTITVYDSFFIVKGRSIVSHAKVFKYTPEMTSIPYRSRSMHHPFERLEAVKKPFLLIHLALLTSQQRAFRDFYTSGISDNNDNLWFLDKSVIDMTSKELKQCRKNSEPTCTIEEYLRNKSKYNERQKKTF